MPESSADIIKDHEDALLRYASRLLGASEDARDVVQEAFLRLLKRDHATGGVDSIENTRAWLYKVVRNLCHDRFRSGERKCEVAVEPEALAGFADSAAGPDAELAEKEEMRVVREAINQLDPRSREIVVLKLEHERSYKEIAAIMELTPTNVGFILHKAMKKLTETLQTYENRDSKTGKQTRTPSRKGGGE